MVNIYINIYNCTTIIILLIDADVTGIILNAEQKETDIFLLFEYVI